MVASCFTAIVGLCLALRSLHLEVKASHVREIAMAERILPLVEAFVSAVQSGKRLFPGGP